MGARKLSDRMNREWSGADDDDAGEPKPYQKIFGNHIALIQLKARISRLASGMVGYAFGAGVAHIHLWATLGVLAVAAVVLALYLLRFMKLVEVGASLDKEYATQIKEIIPFTQPSRTTIPPATDTNSAPST